MPVADLPLEFTLSYDATVETVAASNLSITVDGVSVTRQSNTVTDLVDGVSLSFNNTTSSAVTVSGAYDTDTAYAAAESLVSEINTLLNLLNTATARGFGEDGDLAGDAFAKGMISSIRSILNEQIVGFDDNGIHLAYYGVLTNRDGGISINQTSFNAAYEADPDSFNALLNSRVTTGRQLVSGSVSGATMCLENTALLPTGAAPRSTATL